MKTPKRLAKETFLRGGWREPHWWTEGLPEDVIDDPVTDGPPVSAIQRFMDWVLEARRKMAAQGKESDGK